MHPIERLRHVARSTGAPQGALVAEAAAALASFAGDPHGLVTACRQVVARQPSSGPLLWLAARVVAAPDPGAEVWEAAGLVAADRTGAELAHALPDGATVAVVGGGELVLDALARRGDLEVLAVPGWGPPLAPALLRRGVEVVDVPPEGVGAAAAAADLVVVEPSAVGPALALAPAGSRAAAAVARHAGVPVWAVAGVGRLLPARLWDALAGRVAGDEPWDARHEPVPLDLVDRLVGTAGPEPVAEALARVDVPVPPELLGPGPALWSAGG